MTIQELKRSLLKGKHLEDLLPLSDGQDCTMYKADTFRTDDTILYIPDVILNEIPCGLDLSIDNVMRDASNGAWSSMTAAEQIQVALSFCYTGKMFVELCEGDEALAWRLFCFVDWQHPSSALHEVAYDDEDDETQIKAAYQRWKAENENT